MNRDQGKSPPRLTLSNCYGTDNVGDQAILTCMIELLQSNLGRVEIDVLSRWPAKTRRRHGGVNAVRSGIITGSWATCRSIRRAEMLVFGGGGIIQDASSLGNLLFHLSRLALAILFRTPFVGCGIGVGPIKSRAGRWLTSKILNRADGLYVRDDASAILLRGININRPPTVITSDFANALIPAENFGEEPVYQQVTKLRRQSDCLVGLSLRPQAGKHRQPNKLSPGFADAIRAIARACDELIEDKNATIVFIPMEPREDNALAQTFLPLVHNRNKVLVLPGELKPKVVMSIVGLMDILLGMRLHSLIFGAQTFVPMIGLDYDPKITGFLNSLGLSGQILRIAELDSEKVRDLIEQTLSRRDEIRQSLREHAPKLTANVERNVKAIAELLAKR